AFEFDVEEAERRARLLERVVGPDEEDEGAAEEASARFRLRVSIQEPQPPQFAYSLAKSGDQTFPDPIILRITKFPITKTPRDQKKKKKRSKKPSSIKTQIQETHAI
ncbi:hypothetical protein PanWU01x14_028030, partial [Parasponia andersonii]